MDERQQLGQFRIRCVLLDTGERNVLFLQIMQEMSVVSGGYKNKLLR